MLWVRHASSCHTARAADSIAPRIPPGWDEGKRKREEGRGKREMDQGNGSDFGLFDVL